MLVHIPGFDRHDHLLPELKLTLILIGASERSRRVRIESAGGSTGSL